MDEQGCSRLLADANEKILDRLAGLEKVITPQHAQQALSEINKLSKRICDLSNEVIRWVVLGMGLFTDLPIRHVFKATRRLRAKKSHTSTFKSLHGSPTAR
jgi:hypothetical protein